MVLINKNDDVLHIDGDETWFWCPECKQVHRIPIDDVNEITDKSGYIVCCPNTGVCVEFEKK